MSTTAIQLAFQLDKQPEEMKWLYLSETPLPNGITDLLRLCASSKRLERFSESVSVDSLSIRKILLNFIEEVLVKESNTPQKILGLKSHQKPDKLKLHYQLLMRIFHPDRSISTQAGQSTALLSKAYKELKNGQAELQYFKNITLSRTPPNSFYHATRNAEIHHSGLKSTLMAFGAMGLISLGVTFSYLLESKTPELIATSPIVEPVPEKIPSLNLSSADNTFNIEKANFSGVVTAESTEAILQMMLRDIETYYESGNVSRIKPILANTEEMRSQSDDEMQEKLETLFKITQKRKMLMYRFDWQHISGEIRGVGKFISRYQMANEMNWQTREGTAIVTATEISGSFFVTGLKLENNIIE